MLFLLTFFPVVLHAQLQGRGKIDALSQQLQTLPADTSRAGVLIEISKAFHTINPDTGIIYANSALKLSEEQQWPLGVARAYNALGMNYEAHSDNPTALGYYIKALGLYGKLKDSAKMALVNGDLGNVYNSLGKYPDALEYAMKALNYHQAHKINYWVAQDLGNIGVIYDNQKDYKTAERYYNEAIDIDEEIHNRADIAKNLGNIASLNYSIKNYAKAIALGNKALAIYEELGERKNIAINNGNIGWFYVEMSKDASAGGLGKRGALDKAIEYFKKSISISGDIGYRDGLLDCYNGMSEAYEAMGNTEQALAFFKKYSDVKDSINSTVNKIRLAKIESDLRSTKEREKLANIELKNTQTRLYYLAGIVVLISILIVVGRYLYKQLKSNRLLAIERKKHIERIRAQKTVLKDIAYIQSHEVRGPVSTILGLTQLFNYEDLSDPTNSELMEGITTVANRLDKIVTEVVNKENKLNSAADIESDKEDNI